MITEYDEEQLVLDLFQGDANEAADEDTSPVAPSSDAPTSGPNNIEAQDSTTPVPEGPLTSQTNAPENDMRSILSSIRGFQEELEKNRKEMESQRDLLQLLGADTWSKKQQADELAFVQNMRETFEKDPAQATSTMIRKAQEQLWQAFENRLNEEVRQKSALDSIMSRFSSDPAKARISNFRDEIEFLIRARGMDPEESVGLVQKIAEKFDEIGDRKKTALKKMRAESQFESSQNPAPTNDPDREFNKLMSQSKSLDEMFANLRKLNR